MNSLILERILDSPFLSTPASNTLYLFIGRCSHVGLATIGGGSEYSSQSQHRTTLTSPLPNIIGNPTQIPLIQHVFIDKILRDHEKILSVSIVSNLKILLSSSRHVYFNWKHMIVWFIVQCPSIGILSPHFAHHDPSSGSARLSRDCLSWFIEYHDLSFGLSLGQTVQFPLWQFCKFLRRQVRWIYSLSRLVLLRRNFSVLLPMPICVDLTCQYSQIAIMTGSYQFSVWQGDTLQIHPGWGTICSLVQQETFLLEPPSHCWQM